MYKKLILSSLLFSGVTVLAEAQTDSSTYFYKKEVLPPAINTEYQEARPLISGDGKTLFFNRRKHPDNVGGPRDYQDIYVSYYDPQTNTWSAAENVGKALNDRKRNAVAAVTKDGKEGLFFNTYFNNKLQPIARSRKTDKGWSEPVPISIQNYVNKSTFADFHLSYEQNVLLLAVAGDQTRGGQDLYVSFPDASGGWKKPISLGPVLNTRKSEYAPFLAADGKTLFFCSDGHQGLGGGDIFMSVRLDNSWRKWSKPVNLGPGINTKQEESYFSFTDDMRYIYYISHDNKEVGNRNIVRAELTEDITAINGPLLAQLDSASLNTIMRSGNYTVNPQGATKNFQGVSFSGWPGHENISAASTLEYEQTSARPQNKTAAGGAVASNTGKQPETENEERPAPPASVNEFVPMSAVNDLPAEAQQLKNFLQKQFPNQEVLVRYNPQAVEFKIIEGLHYDFNSVSINQAHLPRLQALKEILESQDNLEAILSGHADAIGTAQANERVSKLRAAYVEAYLKDSGISSERLFVEAKGSADPLVSNDTPQNRRKNRRVETILRLTL